MPISAKNGAGFCHRFTLNPLALLRSNFSFRAWLFPKCRMKF
jgi:hypothetical protein